MFSKHFRWVLVMRSLCGVPGNITSSVSPLARGQREKCGSDLVSPMDLDVGQRFLGFRISVSLESQIDKASNKYVFPVQRKMEDSPESETGKIAAWLKSLSNVGFERVCFRLNIIYF